MCVCWKYKIYVHKHAPWVYYACCCKRCNCHLADRDGQHGKCVTSERVRTVAQRTSGDTLHSTIAAATAPKWIPLARVIPRGIERRVAYVENRSAVEVADTSTELTMRSLTLVRVSPWPVALAVSIAASVLSALAAVEVRRGAAANRGMVAMMLCSFLTMLCMLELSPAMVRMAARVSVGTPVEVWQLMAALLAGCRSPPSAGLAWF